MRVIDIGLLAAIRSLVKRPGAWLTAVGVVYLVPTLYLLHQEFTSGARSDHTHTWADVSIVIGLLISFVVTIGFAVYLRERFAAQERWKASIRHEVSELHNMAQQFTEAAALFTQQRTTP